MPKGTSGNGARLRASSKGRIHAAYSDRLADLKQQAADQFNSFRFLAIRPWQNPRDFTGDPLNIPNLGLPAYNRDEINTNYEECIYDPKNAGTNGDVIALKLQIDYMAAQENAYRHVRASLPRCMAP